MPSGADDLLARAFNGSSEACKTKSAPPLAEEETTQPPPTSITCVDGTLELSKEEAEHIKKIYEPTEWLPSHVVQQFLAASRTLAAARLAVSDAANLRRPDRNGCTPMFHACKNGNLEQAQELFSKGAAGDVIVLNNKGESPMWTSCKHGHLNMVKWLWEHGHSEDGSVYHHSSHSLKSSKKNYFDKISVETKSSTVKRRRTDKQWQACYQGHLDIVVWLSENVGDARTLGRHDRTKDLGLTPMHSACSNGRVEIVEWLIRYMNKSYEEGEVEEVVVEEVVVEEEEEEDKSDLQQQIDALKQQQADFMQQLQQTYYVPGAQGGGGGGGGGYDFGSLLTYSGGSSSKLAPKKKESNKVSAKQRNNCKLHLQQVAMTYMPEFSQLCRELDLVNKETEEAQFNILTLDDMKARKLITFVKNKMKQMMKNEQQRGAGDDNEASSLLAEGEEKRDGDNGGQKKEVKNRKTNTEKNSITRKRTLKSKKSPMCLACEKGHLNIMKLLYDNGAQDDIHEAIVYACRHNHVDILQWLINNKASFEMAPPEMAPPPHQQFPLFSNDALLSKKSLTPMMTACKYGHLDIMQCLGSNGASEKEIREISKGTTEMTPLLYAIENGHLSCVQWLYENGARADIRKGRKGRKELAQRTTSMHLACIHGHLNIAQYLFDHGCAMDIHVKREHNETLMFDICSDVYRGDVNPVPILRWLVAKGASNQLREPDSFGKTPLYCACENDQLDTIQWLCTHGGLSQDISHILVSPSATAAVVGSPLHATCVNESMFSFNTLQWFIHRGMLKMKDVATVIECVVDDDDTEALVNRATECRDVDRKKFLKPIFCFCFCF